MILAMILMAGVGLMWTLVSISQSMVAGRNAPICAYYALATLMAAPLAWVVCLDRGGWEATAPRFVDLALVLFAANVFNCVGQACVVAGMRSGHRAATLAIAQSAMGLTFLATVAIWGERPGAVGMGGLASIVAGILLLSRSRKDKDAPFDLRWLALAVGAFACIGAGQILMTWPSRWEGWTDAARVRTPLSLTCAAVIYGGAMLVLRQRPERGLVVPAILWTGSAVIAFLMLFAALDRLTAAGYAGIVFPVGIGISLAGFAVYSRLRLAEPFSRRTAVGLLCVLGGVGALVARVLV